MSKQLDFEAYLASVTPSPGGIASGVTDAMWHARMPRSKSVRVWETTEPWARWSSARERSWPRWSVQNPVGPEGPTALAEPSTGFVRIMEHRIPAPVSGWHGWARAVQRHSALPPGWSSVPRKVRRNRGPGAFSTACLSIGSPDLLRLQPDAGR